MATRTITVATDGARIVATVRGEGPLVVLVPSLGRGASDFDTLAESLAEAGFMAAAIDPRNAGESCGGTENLTLHNYAADVAAVIDHLGGPAHIVGHAFGNRVSRCLATDRPDLVISIALLAAGGLIEPSPEAREALKRSFKTDLPGHLDAVREAFFAPLNDPTPWSDGWWSCVSAAQSMANRATPREDWWYAGSAPMLVIQGLDDVIAPPANGRALRDELGDRVSLIELENAGHALLPEQPEAIARHLLGFINRHTPVAIA
ncbi:MAG: alpha/beta hydrolase [Dehalococcoidia bacterium]|nr:alpha/beta hydrolase [Dehalococcoidia bacterium]MCA9844006.1 alpha/beta hydrolase [Dehalococcoidia bacterium]